VRARVRKRDDEDLKKGLFKWVLFLLLVPRPERHQSSFLYVIIIIIIIIIIVIIAHTALSFYNISFAVACL
jgi:hypothetical protein